MRILIKHLIAGVIACLTLSGCMQHNGDIGDWFGTWKLESITIDGTESADYQDNIFFQFQTDKVRIVAIDLEPPATRTECFGRWTETDKTLTIDLSHTSASNPGHFNPLPESLMTKGVNTFTIDSKSSKRMQWTMQTVNPERTVTYSLKKQ